MDGEPASRPRRKRFRARLSLRALMLLVLVLGAGIGWKANRARDQRRAVAAIRTVRGSVVYDFQYAGDDVLTPTPMKPAQEPPAPKWLRNLLGDEYFQEVTMVDIRSAVSGEIVPSLSKLDHLVHLGLDGSRLDAPALAEIAKLPRLQALVLMRANVTDAGIANLVGARKLRKLAIHGAAGLTDLGMVSLAGLPDLRSVGIFHAPGLTDLGLKNLGPRLAELETLVLYRTAITDEGMAYLAGCRKLKTLSLSSAKIGDPGFAHFRDLGSLTTLVVTSTGVTDEGLAALGGLANLRSISLQRTAVSGPGLAGLEGLAKLESLMLDESKMTDEGLGPIRKLKGLKSLGLRGTQVSPRAIAELQAERPSLRITSGPALKFPAAPAPTAPPAGN